MKILYVMFIASLVSSAMHAMQPVEQIKRKKFENSYILIIGYIQKCMSNRPRKLYVQRKKTRDGKEFFCGYIGTMVYDEKAKKYKTQYSTELIDLDNDKTTAHLWHVRDALYNKKS